MRVVIAKPCCQLPIGRLGENIATRIIFEVSAFAIYGEGGTFSLLHQRPGDAGPYPVPVTQEGTQVMWDVSNLDTGAAGYGRAQLIYTVNGVIAKADIYTTVIGEALSGGIDPPEPWEDWVTRVLAIGDHLDEWLGKTAGGEPGQVWTRTENGAGWADGGGGGATNLPFAVVNGLLNCIYEEVEENA